MNFEINLIKDKVIPFKRRKIIFLSIISYFAICGLIFIFLFFKTTLTFFKTANLRKHVARLENAFYQNYTEGRNVPGYTAEMRTKIFKYVGNLERVENILSERINLVSLLLNFSQPLPAGAYIDNFDLKSGDPVFSFNVVIPEASIGTAFNISKLIATWRQNASLRSDIQDIKSSEVLRKEIGGQPVLISRFFCSLFKGKL